MEVLCGENLDVVYDTYVKCLQFVFRNAIIVVLYYYLICVQDSMASGAQTAVGWCLMMVQQHNVCAHSLDTLVFSL